MRLFKEFICNDDGATAVEYGLIIGIIGLFLVSGAGIYGRNLGNMFNFLSNKVMVD